MSDNMYVCMTCLTIIIIIGGLWEVSDNSQIPEREFPSGSLDQVASTCPLTNNTNHQIVTVEPRSPATLKFGRRSIMRDHRLRFALVWRGFLGWWGGSCLSIGDFVVKQFFPKHAIDKPGPRYVSPE